MFMPLRDWYVLQVINGREKQIAEKLTDAGIRSCVPEREVNIRQRGKWHRETRLFFDGYVFIRCQYSADIYHTVKRIGGVIRILPDAIHPVALHSDEADFIKICSRGVIGLHDIIRNGNQYEIADGELADPVVCGGQQIYELFLPECDELVLTEVDAETPDADAFFPEFAGDFEVYEEGPDTTENGITYRIKRYKRR